MRELRAHGEAVAGRPPPRAVYTDLDGAFTIDLPPGRYTLIFEMNGFKKVQRENIVLALGQTLNVDIKLELAGVEETVTVSGGSPVVDVQSTKVGTEFTGEKLTGIPSSTDLWAALGQAPGVRMRGFDVGVSDYVLKPFNRAEFVARVWRLMKKR